MILSELSRLLDQRPSLLQPASIQDPLWGSAQLNLKRPSAGDGYVSPFTLSLAECQRRAVGTEKVKTVVSATITDKPLTGEEPSSLAEFFAAIEEASTRQCYSCGGLEPYRQSCIVCGKSSGKSRSDSPHPIHRAGEQLNYVWVNSPDGSSYKHYFEGDGNR